jgi:hypothetical protein
MCIGTTIPSPDSNYIGGLSHFCGILLNVRNFADYRRILPKRWAVDRVTQALHEGRPSLWKVLPRATLIRGVGD